MQSDTCLRLLTNEFYFRKSNHQFSKIHKAIMSLFIRRVWGSLCLYCKPKIMYLWYLKDKFLSNHQFLRNISVRELEIFSFECLFICCFFQSIYNLWLLTLSINRFRIANTCYCFQFSPLLGSNFTLLEGEFHLSL